MEWISEIFSSLLVYLGPIAGVVTAATAITVLTPTKTDDKILGMVLRVLNFLAGNFGKNKNADAE